MPSASRSQHGLMASGPDAQPGADAAPTRGWHGAARLLAWVLAVLVCLAVFTWYGQPDFAVELLNRWGLC